MSEVEIDLGGYQSHAYSLNSYEKGKLAHSMRLVRRAPGSLNGMVKSFRERIYYKVRAVTDESGQILGLRCNCPNGTKGGANARCYHAAAFALSIEKERREADG